MSSDEKSKRPSIFDYLNFLVALIAICIPFILRECDKPKINFYAKYDYNIDIDTYNNFIPSFFSLTNFKHIRDYQNYAKNDSLNIQLAWWARLKQFTLTIKNKRNKPISLNELKISKWNYISQIDGLEPIIVTCFIVDDNDELMVDKIVKLDAGETKELKAIVVFYVNFDSSSIEIVHDESKIRLKAVTDSIVKVDNNWEFGAYIIQIANGKRYNYLIDWLNKEDAAPFIYCDIYKKYFSKIKFNDLQFRFTDNLNRQHYSNTIKYVK